MSDLYQEIIIEEYQHPHNFAAMVNADAEQHERNSSCGDDITMYIQLDEAKHHVKKLTWQGQGCAISQATASLLSVEATGKSVADILKMKKHDLENLLGIEEIVYGREKCLLLSLEAVQKALRNLSEKSDDRG